jgi:hypothetical protein
MSFDYCHAIKNARNIFLNHDMADSNGIISSTYLKNIYNLQKDMIIKPVKFLTRKHIKPNTFEKMNVLRAIQIFSPVITNLLIYFMQMMYRFFKIHDASDRQQHIHQLDPDSAPYKQITDERLNWLKTDFPKYIQDLQHALNV